MPSGHSSAAQIFAITLFLDLFHGKTKQVKRTQFFGWCSWLLGLFVALTWSAVMPLSRYYLGVHSLDQILLGTCLGIWGGLVSHFLLRDNIMNLIKRIQLSHKQDTSDYNGRGYATYIDKVEK